MEIKDVPIWKPIEFSEAWERCSTSKLDVLLPSWVRRRQTLKEDSKAYNQFMERLKRQHAIETGVIEKLYDLSEGVTETFIKEGFVESYLQHGDTNIPPHQLMNYLNDNFSAIDFVFDVVKNNRTFTVSFIKELHQLITRHQDTAEGRDQFGTRLQIPLLKGKFKERENNPTRADGTCFLYCPPIHVDAEMDRLVAILAEMEEKGVKPLLAATWLHHAFVSIHPFQDGNGRVARLLASLVLIKHGLFPLTVKRGEKKRYIDGLELADNGEPQKLVDYFGEMQKRNIESILNTNWEVVAAQNSFEDISVLLAEKLEGAIKKQQDEEDKKKKLGEVFNFSESILVEAILDLKKILGDKTEIKNYNWWPQEGDGSHPYGFEQYAEKFDYFFNTSLPNAGLVLKIKLLDKFQYEVIFSIHHFGYDNSTLAIGAVLERTVSKAAVYRKPIEMPPFTISLANEGDAFKASFEDIRVYLQNVLTLALAQIASEINP